jgi:hypothetical protein
VTSALLHRLQFWIPPSDDAVEKLMPELRASMSAKHVYASSWLLIDSGARLTISRANRKKAVRGKKRDLELEKGVVCLLPASRHAQRVRR